jgi:hypothetical protein
MSKYYDCWKSREDVVGDYGDKTPTEEELIYAGYTYEDYSGSALVVWRRDGKLYENNDGHCSCSGLEHWEPEETSAAALGIRKGWPGLREALDAANVEG